MELNFSFFYDPIPPTVFLIIICRITPVLLCKNFHKCLNSGRMIEITINMLKIRSTLHHNKFADAYYSSVMQANRIIWCIMIMLQIKTKYEMNQKYDNISALMEFQNFFSIKRIWPWNDLDTKRRMTTATFLLLKRLYTFYGCCISTRPIYRRRIHSEDAMHG